MGLLLRHAALLALALCVLSQPVLAAWGEIHALAAHGNAEVVDHRAAHAETAAHALDADAGGEDGDDTASPLHALSHHAHCCGQPQLSSPPQLPLPVFVPLTLVPRPAEARTRAASPPATPFRPPILAG